MKPPNAFETSSIDMPETDAKRAMVDVKSMRSDAAMSIWLPMVAISDSSANVSGSWPVNCTRLLRMLSIAAVSSPAANSAGSRVRSTLANEAWNCAPTTVA